MRIVVIVAPVSGCTSSGTNREPATLEMQSPSTTEPSSDLYYTKDASAPPDSNDTKIQNPLKNLPTNERPAHENIDGVHDAQDFAPEEKERVVGSAPNRELFELPKAAESPNVYNVRISGDNELTVGGPLGTLLIVISPDSLPSPKSTVVTSDGELRNHSDFVKVELHAANLIFQPTRTECTDLSEGFALPVVVEPKILKEEVEEEVKVRAHFYDHAQCQDAAHSVLSGNQFSISIKPQHWLSRIWKIFGEKLEWVWGSLLTMILGTILFYLRQKIASLIGGNPYINEDDQ